jgi:site-specific recombinase XerD
MLPRNAFDGRGFHSLRRAFGKGMVTAGVPIEAVAQAIGDSHIDSVKKYVSLDSHHLKECALDFSGIEFSADSEGGAYK